MDKYGTKGVEQLEAATEKAAHHIHNRSRSDAVSYRKPYNDQENSIYNKLPISKRHLKKPTHTQIHAGKGIHLKTTHAVESDAHTDQQNTRQHQQDTFHPGKICHPIRFIHIAAGYPSCSINFCPFSKRRT